jgi:hypothetical protein
MCIFCGGACGGAVDVILPSLVAGAGLVVLKVQAMRDSRKKDGTSEGESVTEEPDTEEAGE